MLDLVKHASQWGPEWLLILGLVAERAWFARRQLAVLERIAEERAKTRASLDRVAAALNQLASRVRSGGS